MRSVVVVLGALYILVRSDGRYISQSKWQSVDISIPRVIIRGLVALSEARYKSRRICGPVKNVRRSPVRLVDTDARRTGVLGVCCGRENTIKNNAITEVAVSGAGTMSLQLPPGVYLGSSWCARKTHLAADTPARAARFSAEAWRIGSVCPYKLDIR